MSSSNPPLVHPLEHLVTTFNNLPAVLISIIGEYLPPQILSYHVPDDKSRIELEFAIPLYDKREKIQIFVDKDKAHLDCCHIEFEEDTFSLYLPRSDLYGIQTFQYTQFRILSDRKDDLFHISILPSCFNYNAGITSTMKIPIQLSKKPFILCETISFDTCTDIRERMGFRNQPPYPCLYKGPLLLSPD